MDLTDITELHFITPITNLPSILRDGILCHRSVAAHPHATIAMPEVQAIRETVRVPDGSLYGRPLHTYANLYVHARNPMMYVRKSQHETLCVLCVSPAVLGLPGVVIADGNAGSRGGYTLFAAMPGGLAALDKDLVFAEYWTDPDTFSYWERKRKRCAEVLVPDAVPPTYIVAAKVSGEAAAGAVRAVAPALSIHVDAHLFFR